MDGVANETLAMYFWQVRGADVIEIAGVVVGPRWRYHNFQTFPEDATWMARTACSEACLAVYLHEIHSGVKSTGCPRDGTPVFGSTGAVSSQKSVGLSSVRVGCSVAWKLRMDTISLEWNERPRIDSFHSNRSNPAE